MNKLEQAAREVVRQHSMECLSDKAVDALRKALASRCQTTTTEQTKQSQLADASLEPVAWRCRYCKTDMPTEHASDCPIERFGLPNEYATPVRTKDPCNPLQDLTDDEISVVFLNSREPLNEWSFARAVIAADREKNK